MIEILSPHVANLIAAGEVVERPSSVVKELVENSFDAGASAVTVEIKRGGVSMIRVTDNGEGMDAEDAARAFMRHATSKLRTAEDLQTIATMGFRGEALAAIASVSRIELLTRERGQSSGCSLSLEAGAVTGQEEAGCPEGTTIIIRDLFFNIPARQKFLKKDNTEAASAQEAAVRAALARPDCSVRFIKDGSQALHTPGGSLKDALYSIFGGDFTRSLLPLSHENEGPAVRVSGFVGSPQLVRSSRFLQYFIVENRPVRSRILTAALEEAFSGSLMTGRFPVCAIHIGLPLEAFDINVHPAKAEVKFRNEREVFDAVYHACREALSSSNDAPPLRFNLQGGSGLPLRISGGDAPSAYQAALPRTPAVVPSAPSAPAAAPRPQKQEYLPPRTQESRPPVPSVPPAANPPEPPAVKCPEQPSPAWRLIGEAMSGYLLVETADTLWVIDKHAAHERLIFNKLAAGERPFFSQQLIAPLTVVLSGPERDILLEERSFLEQTGFELEEFGPQTLAVRAAPGDVDESDIPALLSEMASLLRDKRRPDIRNEAMQAVACKAAVKLGRSSSRADMEYLAGRVMETPDLRHCPHGRPVAIRLTRGDLGRQFGR